jgi:hypothetical protein
MTRDEDDFDAFVRTLRNFGPSMIVEGLAAAFDEADLERIATELDELLLHLSKSGEK